MQLSVLFSILAIVPALLAKPEGYCPFANPVANVPFVFAKRQNSCADGETSCGSLGSNECCAAGQNCQLDQAGNVACCPYNVVCTGTIGVPRTTTVSSTTPTSESVIGSTTTPISTSATPFQTPITSGVAGGGSTVANTYYPFVYIPTSYANPALCSAAWTTCQSESSACLASLAGQYGVTVSGFGFGTTVTGQSGLILSSASSICSSLSAVACYNINLNTCASAHGAGARPTACPGMVYAAGVAAGVAGALM